MITIKLISDIMYIFLIQLFLNMINKDINNHWGQKLIDENKSKGKMF